MGWLFTEGTDKKALVASINARRTAGGMKILKSRLVGNHHWYVAVGGNGKSFIGLDLIKIHRGEIGYKDMDESMGPYYYDCPESFIKISPVDPEDKNSIAWREKVIAHHARKARSYEVGMVIVYGGNKYTLSKKITPTRWSIVDEHGRVYSASTTLLNKSELI
jgi:hypothetical protein